MNTQKITQKITKKITQKFTQNSTKKLHYGVQICVIHTNCGVVSVIVF